MIKPIATRHHERHRSEHIGWLRAAVLGANDGLISTSSLLVGVAAAAASPQTIVMTGVAALVAGALSMAAGEYVSVSSQADAERADTQIEAAALRDNPNAELDELAAIYVRRGLEPALARTVAEQLTAHDGLGSHLRDELGFNEHSRAKPVQAALASAAAFTCGALPPVLLAWLWQKPGLATAIVACTLVLLAVLGYVAERVAGGRGLFGAGRVVLWGALAMVATALIGSAFGVSV